MIESEGSGFSKNVNRTRVGVSPSVAPAMGSERFRPACAHASRGLTAPRNVTRIRRVRLRRDTSGIPPAAEQSEANRRDESEDGDPNAKVGDILGRHSPFHGALCPWKGPANPLGQLAHRWILRRELEFRDIGDTLESAVRASGIGINRLVL